MYILGSPFSPLQRHLQTRLALLQSCALPWFCTRRKAAWPHGFSQSECFGGKNGWNQTAQLSRLCAFPLPGHGPVVWGQDSCVCSPSRYHPYWGPHQARGRETERPPHSLQPFCLWCLHPYQSYLGKNLEKYTLLFPTLFNSLDCTVSVANDNGGWPSTDPRDTSHESTCPAPPPGVIVPFL